MEDVAWLAVARSMAEVQVAPASFAAVEEKWRRERTLGGVTAACSARSPYKEGRGQPFIGRWVTAGRRGEWRAVMAIVHRAVGNRRERERENVGERERWVGGFN